MFPMFFPRQELSAAKAEDAAASQARPKWSVMGGCITYHVLSCMNTVVICHDNYCIILSDYIYIILYTLVVWRIILSYRWWCATVEDSILSHFFWHCRLQAKNRLMNCKRKSPYDGRCWRRFLQPRTFVSPGKAKLIWSSVISEMSWSVLNLGLEDEFHGTLKCSRTMLRCLHIFTV